jgi:Ca-activated chloride channel family protein
MRRLYALLVVLLCLTALVSACEVGGIGDPSSQSANPAVKEIKVAYEPNKARMFEELVNAYNAKATVKVRAIKQEIPQMIDSLAKSELIGVSPDSALWLESFDKAWQETHPGNASIVGTTVRYATTPVVIATWRGRENELGNAEERGWASLLQRAASDSNYRWSHGSPRASASGMLSLIAEFYAGAGKTFGLTKADADKEDVRRYVAQIEGTIARYGGESDAELVEYLLKEGPNSLAAVVMSEASAFDFNQRSRGPKLFAIHPVEGTLMLDHPLILLETASLTPEQRRAFLDFGRFLTSADGQRIVVKHGYRPVDLDFEMERSPLASEGMSISQPRLVQMPTAGTLAYLQAAWATGLKRRANIVLVVDVSGSMEGEKMTRTKDALASFVRQIPSDEERVALTTFSNDFEELVPLGRLGDNRQQLLAAIDGLSPYGSTALFYAVWRGNRILSELRDGERINVVVAMTDGKENYSNRFADTNIPGLGKVPELIGGNPDKIQPLVAALKQTNSSILLFNVAYGSDADLNMLNSLATAFGGRAYRADPDTIRRLYELISQNF